MELTQHTYNADLEALYQSVAKILLDSLSNHIDKQSKVTLSICGGRSVAGVFKYVAQKETLAWDKVHLFLVDERVVPITDAESNFKLASDSLIDPLFGELLENNVHPFIIDESAADKGASIYTQKISEYNNKFDVLLLSMGEDGHIGALYPNHHSIKDESMGYIYMDDSPKAPPQRVTATKNLILNTDTVVLMVFGESKREAFKKLMDDSVSFEDCPAKLISKIPNRYLFTDLQI